MMQRLRIRDAHRVVDRDTREVAVTRPCPMPSVIERPEAVRSPCFTQPYSPLPSGSASTMRTAGFWAFKRQ